MWREKFTFSSDDPHLAVAYAKAVLPMVGNIMEFTVYRDYDKTPYRDGNDAFTFILKDNQENQIWLRTLCGYSGSGPSATQEILLVLGLQDDYGITERDYFHVTDLHPSFRFNAQVSKNTHRRVTNDKPLFWVSCNFENAYQLRNFRNCLKSLGYLNPARDQFIEVPSVLKEHQGQIEWADYATNNQLTLVRPFESMNSEHLKEIVQNIVNNNSGKVEFLDIPIAK